MVGGWSVPRIRYSKVSLVGSRLKGCATKITKVKRATALVMGEYNKDVCMSYRIIALKI